MLLILNVVKCVPFLLNGFPMSLSKIPIVGIHVRPNSVFVDSSPSWCVLFKRQIEHVAVAIQIDRLSYIIHSKDYWFESTAHCGFRIHRCLCLCSTKMPNGPSSINTRLSIHQNFKGCWHEETIYSICLCIQYKKKMWVTRCVDDFKKKLSRLIEMKDYCFVNIHSIQKTTLITCCDSHLSWHKTIQRNYGFFVFHFYTNVKISTVSCN